MPLKYLTKNQGTHSSHTNTIYFNKKNKIDVGMKCTTTHKLWGEFVTALIIKRSYNRLQSLAPTCTKTNT